MRSGRASTFRESRRCGGRLRRKKFLISRASLIRV
jgi:hypothetical protein